MAVDGKYGQVTLEHGSVAETEPVVVFRAQDKLLPELLEHYVRLCAAAGSPERHLDLIHRSIQQVREWQQDHHTQVPNSESSRAWQGDWTHGSGPDHR